MAVCGLALAVDAQERRPVVLFDIDGPIGAATSDFVARGFAKARDRGAALIVLRIDTPGGLDTSMREIIQEILSSPIPVASYVAPSGARAASAGTYILYASHVAAMAPGTNLGAATPVQIGGLPMPGVEPEKEPPAEPETETETEGDGKEAPAKRGHPTLADKAVNDAIAYIRGLADLRGRNADWAETAVSEAASLPASDALEQGVIDLVADDLDELLEKIDGRSVDVLGDPHEIRTASLTVEVVEPDWRSKFLAVITNPNVAYILMLIGIYGIIFEFYSPGMILPGVVGAICLIIAFYAFQILPINYAGLALLLLGIALMTAEAFVPNIGALGLGGAAAFVIGSVMLLDTDVPGYQISWMLIGSIAAVSAGFFLLVMTMLLRARRRAVVTGPEEMVGSSGRVLAWADGAGRIRVHGEIWQARSAEPVSTGGTVRVEAIDGLTLVVTPEGNGRGGP